MVQSPPSICKSHRSTPAECNPLAPMTWTSANVLALSRDQLDPAALGGTDECIGATGEPYHEAFVEVGAKEILSPTERQFQPHGRIDVVSKASR